MKTSLGILLLIIGLVAAFIDFAYSFNNKLADAVNVHYGLVFAIAIIGIAMVENVRSIYIMFTVYLLGATPLLICAYFFGIKVLSISVAILVFSSFLAKRINLEKEHEKDS